MNTATFNKIRSHADILRRIHSEGNFENLELFDEPYKLALQVLDYPGLNDFELAKLLSKDWQTIKQIRAALAG